jgi:hypothetical protein
MTWRGMTPAEHFWALAHATTRRLQHWTARKALAASQRKR